MSKLHFEFHSKSPEICSLDFPVEIRKPNLVLVARSVISQPVEVPAGTYYVTVKMPAGQELLQEVKVGKRSKTVSLTPEPEDEAPDATQELLHFLQEPIETETSPQSITAKVRGFSGNVLMGNCNEINTEGWHRHSLETDNVVQLNADGDDEIQLLQLLQPGKPAINFALPVSSKNGCSIIFQPVSDAVTVVNIHLNNSMANLLLQYREQGYIQQALTTATSNYLSPEKLLAGDTQDAIAAIVRAYTILRFGELQQLDNWTLELKNQFRWLPDAVTIRGEYLARLGEHQQAISVFLELPLRGLPIFSDGFSYALDRLRLYLSVGEGHFTESQLSQARDVLGPLQRFAIFIDFTKPLLTFTGLNPATPNFELLNTDIELYEGLSIADYCPVSVTEKEQISTKRFLERCYAQLEQKTQTLKLLNEYVVPFKEFFNGFSYLERNPNQTATIELSESKKERFDLKTLESTWQNSHQYFVEIQELQDLILQKERELKNKRLPISEAEKVDLQNYITQLNSEIARLKKIAQRLDDIKEALDWLNPANTKKLIELAEEAGKYVLSDYPECSSLSDFKRFCRDIKRLLFVIYGCLLIGNQDLIDHALAKKIVPNPYSPLKTTNAYVNALIFIRDQKVKMSGQPAEELKIYLNYLIDKLHPDSANVFPNESVE